MTAKKLKKCSQMGFALAILFLLPPALAEAQYWEKHYAGSSSFFGDAISAYDKGCYILYSPGTATGLNAELIKTDINGNILWGRTLGKTVDSVMSDGICETRDGGCILTGYTYLNNMFLLKLDACGEKEWCRIYTNEVQSGDISGITQLKNGDYVFYNDFGGLQYANASWVICVSPIGDMKWKFFSPMTIGNMHSDSLGNITVCGEADYYLAPGLSRGYYTMANIDTNGNKKWLISFDSLKGNYGTLRGFYQAHDGSYISTGETAELSGNDTWAPLVFESGLDGKPNWYKLIGDTTADQEPEDLCAINDSTYIIPMVTSHPPKNPYDYVLGFTKINNKADILERVSYPDSIFYLFPLKMHPTTDGKFLATGVSTRKDGTGDIFVYKINANLGIDSLDHNHYNYDSLCPKGVAKSETITLDATDTTYIKIPTSIAKQSVPLLGLDMYPNPASGRVFLFCKGLNRQVVQCNIYDIDGQIAATRCFSPDPIGNLNAELDISGLAKGIYFVEMLQPNRRFVQKLVVE